MLCCKYSDHPVGQPGAGQAWWHICCVLVPGLAQPRPDVQVGEEHSTQHKGAPFSNNIHTLHIDQCRWPTSSVTPGSSCRSWEVYTGCRGMPCRTAEVTTQPTQELLYYNLLLLFIRQAPCSHILCCMREGLFRFFALELLGGFGAPFGEVAAECAAAESGGVTLEHNTSRSRQHGSDR